MTKRWFSAMVLVMAAVGVFAQDEEPVGIQDRIFTKTFKELDIAVNGFTAVIQDRAFIVEGYMYPAGTLDGTNGINPDGTPEFPDLVLGVWICSGWFTNERPDSAFIVGARTSQTFEFNDQEPGKDMIVSYGLEPAEFEVVFERAIIGGTGEYAHLTGGVQKQRIIGVNSAGTVNMAVSFSESFKIRFKGDKN